MAKNENRPGAYPFTFDFVTAYRKPTKEEIARFNRGDIDTLPTRIKITTRITLYSDSTKPAINRLRSWIGPETEFVQVKSEDAAT